MSIRRRKAARADAGDVTWTPVSRPPDSDRDRRIWVTDGNEVDQHARYWGGWWYKLAESPLFWAEVPERSE